MRNRHLMRLQRLDNIDSEDANVEIYRFGRIIFEMNCSPFLLNATLKQHVPNNWMTGHREERMKVKSLNYIVKYMHALLPEVSS